MKPDLRFFGLLSSLVVVLFGGCEVNSDTVDDCPGERIAVLGVQHPGSGDVVNYAVSGQDNIVRIQYKSYYGGSYGVTLNARAADQSLYQLGYYPDAVIANSECHESDITWNGYTRISYNGRLFPLPLPPGDYTFEAGYAYINGTQAIRVNPNSWDSDGDNISTTVENENNGSGGCEQTIIVDVDGVSHTGWFVSDNRGLPPLIPTTVSSGNDLYPNRGTHDYSLALGGQTSGSLYNGLRLPHAGTGYYHFLGRDALDSDNWGVLQTINAIEAVGRAFASMHPNSARMGCGDISLPTGGFWDDHPGRTHQQGLIVDVRYMNTDNEEVPFAFTADPAHNSHFDAGKTWDLVSLFISLGANKIIVDEYTGFTESSVVVLEIHGTGHHSHHFHVEFPDPDGTAN